MLSKIFLADVPSGIVSFNFIGPLLKILSINIASDTFPSIKKVPVGTFEAKPRIRILAFNTFLLTIRLFSCNRLITLFKDIDYSQLQILFRQNLTYIHSSEYETVGLPIYEAQNLGLKLVIPKRTYTNYFRSENVFTYELNNPQSALIRIEEAKNFNIKNSPALIYNENWSKILEYI